MKILVFVCYFFSVHALSEGCTDELFEVYHGEYKRDKGLYVGNIGFADSYNVLFFDGEISLEDYVKKLDGIGYSVDVLSSDVSMSLYVLDISARDNSLRKVNYFFNAGGRSISISYLFVSHEIAAYLDGKILGKISKCLTKQN